MEKENKKQYESPHLTVVEFKTEQGFAASGGVSNYNNNSSESWFDGLTGGGSGVSDYSNNSSEGWF